MKKLLILIIPLLFFNCEQEIKTQTIEEIQFKSERKNPLSNFEMTYEVRKRLLHKGYNIFGEIKNKSKYNTFKDAKLRLEFYSKTETYLSQKNLTIFEKIKPNSKLLFNENVKVPKGTRHIRVELIEIKPI